jgi:uncharacterized protein YfbU (UPF0304 family)
METIAEIKRLLELKELYCHNESMLSTINDELVERIYDLMDAYEELQEKYNKTSAGKKEQLNEAYSQYQTVKTEERKSNVD